MYFPPSHVKTVGIGANQSAESQIMQSKLPMIIAIDVVVTIGVLGAAFAWWQCDSSATQDSYGIVQSGHESPSQFASEFADAFRAKDTERLKSYFCWEGVDAWTRETVEECIAEDLQNELVDVTVIPTDPEQILEYELKGTRFVPNLEVVGQLKVTYQRDGNPEPMFTSYLLGQKDSRYLISLAAPGN